MFSMRVPFLLPGVFAFAGLGASLIAGSTWAQTTPADPSASVIAQPQAASAQSDNIDQQIAVWTQDPAAANAAAAQTSGQTPPRQIHGEAGVAFGSSGYRSAYIATDIPIGQNSDLGVAVGETDFKPKHYGEIRNRSLAISLNIGGSSNGAPVNCGSPTVAMDGRYLEPLWVARSRGEALARDQAACGAPVSYRGDGGPTNTAGVPDTAE